MRKRQLCRDGNCAETDSRVEKVAQALLSRALGCTVTETRTEWSDKGGEKTVTTVKEMPPDISAQMFWLKNRCPEQWRDKPPEPESQLQHPDNNLFEKLWRRWNRSILRLDCGNPECGGGDAARRCLTATEIIYSVETENALRFRFWFCGRERENHVLSFLQQKTAGGHPLVGWTGDKKL